jgi:hypothetical protein
MEIIAGKKLDYVSWKDNLDTSDKRTEVLLTFMTDYTESIELLKASDSTAIIKVAGECLDYPKAFWKLFSDNYGMNKEMRELAKEFLKEYWEHYDFVKGYIEELR